MLNFPKDVEITESAARDGFQSIPEWIPTERKIEVIEALIACGYKRMELTSFVHPKAIPQMRDADEVADVIMKKYKGRLRFLALVPNLYGARKAVEKKVDDIEVVVSATDEHNQANTKQTIAQSMEGFKEINAIKGDSRLCFSVVTAFVCPFTGPVDPQKVVCLLEKALEMGADQILVADTTGTANPRMLGTLLSQIRDAFPDRPLGLHLHDTKGFGLANVLTALDLGIIHIDGSAGGLGGCPFTPGAAGNIATEDLVTMLEEMGVSTGIHMGKLWEAVDLIGQLPGVRVNSHMSVIRAGKSTCAE